MSSILKNALPLLVAATSIVNAAPLPKPDDTNATEMAALLALLEAETELATQSKMNADYVPGMVTILHGDELRAYGAATVTDALNRVAGFYMTVNNAGDPVAIVRGVGASLNATNLKILIDGVAVNRPVDASTDWAFRLPVTQVDRIEIIRGPGSALYGEFAFAGVVNIITRKDNRVSIRGGSNDLLQGDVLINRTFATGATFSLNLSSWDRNDSGLRTHLDNFARNGNGHSPGEVYDHEQGNTVFVDTAHHGYRIQLQYAQVERGGWYGRNAAMPEDLEPREETVTNLQLDKTWYIGADLEVAAKLGYLQTDLENATFLPLPAGVRPPGRPAPLLVDIFRRDGNEDSSQRTEVNLHWSGIEDHRVFFELSHVKSEVESSYFFTYAPEAPRMYGSADQALVLAGSERTLTSATLQDQWQALDNLELTLGIRYDDYDDWGNSTSPRAAAVWRAGGKNIFKVQYAEAFRPPTLANQYPGPDSLTGTAFVPLQEERLSSTEFAYIYNGTGYSFRSTLFHTKVKDLIEFFLNPGDPPTLRNRGDLESTGLELEWQQQIDRDWEWHANLSYVDAEDHLDSDGKLVGAVEWLANLGVSWRSGPHTRHALAARYVGEQEGWDIAPGRHAQTFDAHTTLDYTLTLTHLAGITNLSMLASINNITDRQYDTAPNPAQYPQGLPRGERTGWLQLSYDF